ncbi:MAG: bifunctional metallophosphatase/5'-nucleotidase [Deltaproteobacteria bacterium]|nr:bifunctional metallophosphatase/5'-nucleotidase [Deltaproteobacteria bacterium]
MTFVGHRRSIRPRRLASAFIVALAALTLALTAAGCTRDSDAAPADNKTITVFFTNDVNGEQSPCGCKSNPSGGLAKRATLLAKVRSENENVLVFDVGNQMHPHPMVEKTNPAMEAERADLFVKSLNAMHYTAAVPGVLDLALGADEFKTLVAAAEYPMLGGNVHAKGEKTPLLKDSMIVESAGYKVGLVGVVDNESTWREMPVKLPTFEIRDPKAYLKTTLEALAPKVDFIILLAHMDVERLKAMPLNAAGDKLAFILSSNNQRRLFQDVNVVDKIPVMQLPPRGREAGVLTIAPSGDDFKFKNRTELDRARTRLSQFEAMAHRMEEQAGSEGIAEYYKDSPSSLERYDGYKAKIEEQKKEIEELTGPGAFFELKTVNLGDDVKGDTTIDGWVSAFETKYPEARTP